MDSTHIYALTSAIFTVLIFASIDIIGWFLYKTPIEDNSSKPNTYNSLRVDISIFKNQLPKTCKLEPIQEETNEESIKSNRQ